jgi:hypothetical protein
MELGAYEPYPRQLAENAEPLAGASQANVFFAAQQKGFLTAMPLQASLPFRLWGR